MTFEHPRLLFVDSYDSFTFNLASLFRLSIPNCAIYIIKNDQFTISDLLPHLPHFSAIIVGPGPGSPDDPKDIGIVKDLWKVGEEHLLPIFGVCLGLQSLSLEYGARLKRLRVVKHGQISIISHTNAELFDGVHVVQAVRYHSLCVEMLPDGDIEPLAWADDGEENGLVVMAVKHRSRPFWAVQYHPESVRTNGGGLEVIRNFWRLAQNWSTARGRGITSWSPELKQVFGSPWPPTYPHSQPPSPSLPPALVTTTITRLGGLTVPRLCELFGATDEESPFVLLDSAAHPGRYSILGCLSPTSLRITYSVNDSHLFLTRGRSRSREALGTLDVWTWLSAFMRDKKARGGRPESPFWGGLIGLLSYELGVNTLGCDVKAEGKVFTGEHHPDVNLVFAERSVIVDSTTGQVYVQSILPDDDAWIHNTSSLITEAASKSDTTPSPVKQPDVTDRPTVTIPDKHLYISKIKQAMEHLFAGDSYELCLTAQTRVTLPSTSSSWDRFTVLRKNNPAPHSAYFRLQPTTFLSSSPERFLSFSRPPNTLCQLRPIKGTVRKGPGITRADAELALAGSAKEVAENLMIVDLIRHDLHAVVGEDVLVKQFCSVEEYETVFQLVSVIEGRLANRPVNQDLESQLGWEVLQRSLPPGSMTGAPKKRSVEILQALEDGPRGLYSGVFGYWCVGGGGDWSVTIRSCFKYDNTNATEDEQHDRHLPSPEEWVIGAGGAITALSDPEAEWEEMVVKLQSVLKSFGATLPKLL